MTVASVHNTFQTADESLTQQGFKHTGSDGMLGHIYTHEDGRKCRVVGNMQGQCEVQILKQAA